jgi:hypothetical protein
MRSKQILITIYFDESDNLILDLNTDENYEYENCITKVIGDHLKEVNDDARIIDVAIDTENDRIKKLVGLNK